MCSLCVGFHDGESRTTRQHFENRNGQRGHGTRGVPGNDHVQLAHKLECLKCGHVYGANSSDVFQRKCPRCQGGAPGIPY